MEKKIANDLFLINLKCKESYDFILYQTSLTFKRINKSNKNNVFSLIEELKITNISLNEYSNLILHIESNINFIKFNDTFIEFLNPDQNIFIDELDPIIDFEKLYDITELINIVLTMSLTNGDQILIKDNIICQLFSFLQSEYTYKFPELLSCFITPNDCYIDKLEPLFLNELEKINGEKKFIGYQNTKSSYIIAEMMAIFNALNNYKIAYSNPPASFEKFQKIRIPQCVLNMHKGTCLDLSILYCACLENIGLHPILIITNSHAYAGCFLNEDDSFVDKISDDASNIYNNSTFGNNNLCLVECTQFTIDKYADFNLAVKTASELTKDNVNFFKAIDVFSCHKSFYKAIPTPSIDNKIEFNLLTEGKNEKLEITDLNKADIILKPSKEENKFTYWERKLLDLNGKNKLINLKFNNSLLQVATSDYKSLLKHLSEKTNFKVLLNQEFQKNSDTLYFAFNGDENKRIIEDSLSKGILKVYSTEKDYKKTIKKSLDSVEETGANPLYVTIGLIRYNFDNSKKIYYAPLLLIPIRGKIKKSNNLFEIELDIDNAFLNITLFEFLKLNANIDFSELSGTIDNGDLNKLSLVFNTIRTKSTKECQIVVDENATFIGNFSFGNFILWDDIKNRKSQLMENNVINSLVNGTNFYSNNQQCINDDSYIPSDIAIPLSADSSQIKAIIEASLGETFVLDGPPGTGKSQTIVNMIVNALYHGKTVLFVAEKMAALEVVYKRIKEIGLDKFVLELHSNKATKRSVLSQLEEAKNFEQSRSPEEFKLIADKLLNKKSELNLFINKMHENKYFASLYDSILKYEEVKEYADKINVTEEFILSLDKNKDEEVRANLKKLIILYNDKGPFIDNPFYVFKLEKMSNNTKDELNIELINLLDLLTKISYTFDELNNKLDFEIIYDRKKIETINKILNIVFKKKIIFNITESENAIKFHDLNLKIFSLLDENNEIYNTYLSHFINRLEMFKSSEFLSEYNSSNDREKRKIIKIAYKSLKKLLINKKEFKLNKKNVLDVITNANIYYENLDFINKNSTILIHFLKLNISEISENLNEYKEIYLDSISFYKEINALELLDNSKYNFFKKVEVIYDNKDEFLIYSFNKFNDLFNKLKILESSMNERYKFDINLYNKKDEYFKCYINLIKLELSNLDYFEDILIYNKILSNLNNLKFSTDFIIMYRQGILLEDDLVKYYDSSLYKQIIMQYFKDEYFSTFNGLLFNDAIDEYKKILNKYSLLVIEETASRISSHFPVSNVDYAQSTDVYKLNKLIKNGGYKTSIRNMLADFEGLIRTLCPCFLMSPLSAAQYLKIDSKKFDIVIFDEASQIPTYEAIGAIARGNNLIVAGDPEQLPPTNFFKNNSDDDMSYDNYQNLTNYEDLESLLDDCLALGIKSNRLLWHYRSKHESLIAFSNNYFYDNSLYTFPSPTNNMSNVKFNYIPLGVNNNGVNKEVGRAILNEVSKRFKDKNLQHKTIGIVTFNIKQQEYISDLINDFFDLNPQYSIINENNPDQLFVKNLENVQGDERDVILFSIGFSKNNKGKLNLFFGPLSLDKGERRLNVAITRAREEMIVFSSIKSSDINSDKAKNYGALALKNFLNYAEKGYSTLIATNSNVINHKFGVEKFIQQDLLEKGYRSDIGIGESKFRIDLGVKDNSNNYILGVMCDSESYNNAKTCRDRNVIQNSMCNKLNWKIYHIWTIDYYKNPKKVINELINVIQNIDRIKFSDNSFNINRSNLNFSKKEQNFIDNSRAYYKYQATNEYDYKNRYINEIYYHEELKKFLQNLINNEGPISLDIIKDRFKDYINVKKWGNNVENLFIINFRGIEAKISKTLEKEFYWPIDVPNFKIEYYRKSSYLERSLENIPIEEFKVVINDILMIQNDLSFDDLIRLIAIKFGYSKITDSTYSFLSKIINEAINRNNDKIDDYINSKDNLKHVTIKY